DLADRSGLLLAQRRLAEVAHVAHARPVQRQHEDRVRPALRARDLVVLRCDRDDLADRRLEPPTSQPSRWPESWPRRVAISVTAVPTNIARVTRISSARSAPYAGSSSRPQSRASARSTTRASSRCLASDAFTPSRRSEAVNGVQPVSFQRQITRTSR